MTPEFFVLLVVVGAARPLGRFFGWIMDGGAAWWPLASQEAIKKLGTNGGGFFNANSAHPYENPNALSNFLEMVAVLPIPAALVYTFGLAVGDTRQGWALLAAMVLVFAVAVTGLAAAEQQGNPAIAALGVNQNTTCCSPAAIWRASKPASASPPRRCSTR